MQNVVVCVCLRLMFSLKMNVFRMNDEDKQNEITSRKREFFRFFFSIHKNQTEKNILNKLDKEEKERQRQRVIDCEISVFFFVFDSKENIEM